MNTIGVKVDGIHVVWAAENGNLLKVKLAGSTIWENSPMGFPPPELPWTTSLSGTRDIPPGGSKPLVSYFTVFPLARFDDFYIQVHFDNGCIISGGT